jgi:hypothetical protein
MVTVATAAAIAEAAAAAAAAAAAVENLILCWHCWQATDPSSSRLPLPWVPCLTQHSLTHQQQRCHRRLLLWRPLTGVLQQLLLLLLAHKLRLFLLFLCHRTNINSEPSW